MKTRVLIAAGGTGGHLFPAQQLAEMLKGDAQVFFAGHHLSKSPFFQKEGLEYLDIPAAAPNIKSPFRFLFQTIQGVWQSIRVMRRFNPDIVVGFGSYHSFPVLLAACILRKKIVLFEANSVLGKVNRLFLPLANKIAFQFPITLSKAVTVPFLPWKKWKGLPSSKEEARLYFGLDPKKMTILVFGGSQGARFLNETVPLALSNLKDLDIQVLHFYGKDQTPPMYSCSSCTKPFEERMDLAYTASDFAICRSGASTIAELIRSQLPALLIPFPFATEDHQTKNGNFFVNSVQGGRLMRQKEASLTLLQDEISSLIQNLPSYRKSIHFWLKNNPKPSDFSELIRELAGKR